MLKIKMATAMFVDMEQQSDETFELFCSPCKRKNRNIEAEKYCADCNDYYCLDCVKCHEEIPALSGHKVTDKSQAQAKPTERCPKHRFTPVDLYCQNHDVVGCVACMAVDHSVCKDIFDIPVYVQNNKDIEGIQSIQKDLQKTKGDLKENIDACNRELQRLLKNKEDALISLHEFRNKIIKRLDELEHNSIAAIEERYNTIVEKINEELRLLENSHEEVKTSIDSFSSSGSNVAQIFVSCKQGKRSIQLETRCCEEASTRKKKHKFQFKADAELLTNLKAMNNLGVTISRDKLLVTGNKQQYYIKHTSDTKPCYISSACVLEDGSIVLADRTNKKLKLLNRNYTVIDVCNLQFEPWQICMVDKNKVAGIANGGKTIVLITVGIEMVKAKEITTDHRCYGIAAADDNVYVTSDKTSVIVYSMSGTKLKELSIDRAEQDLFRRHYGIVVSDNKKIYVTDGKCGLVVLNVDGMLEGKYACSEVYGAKRVCLIENGSVLVSGEGNNWIQQFTSEGENLGNVLSSESRYNTFGAVCYDPQRYRLLVGRPDKDKVDIYELL